MLTETVLVMQNERAVLMQVLCASTKLAAIVTGGRRDQTLAHFSCASFHVVTLASFGCLFGDGVRGSLLLMQMVGT